jgi:hypothetical protein
MIAHRTALVSPVCSFQTSFITEIRDQLLSIGKIGGVYKYW